MASENKPSRAHAYPVSSLALVDTVCGDIAAIHRLYFTDSTAESGEMKQKMSSKRLITLPLLEENACQQRDSLQVHGSRNITTSQDLWESLYSYMAWLHSLIIIHCIAWWWGGISNCSSPLAHHILLANNTMKTIQKYYMCPWIASLSAPPPLWMWYQVIFWMHICMLQ